MILIAGLVLGLRSAELEDKEIGKGVPVSKEESCEARTGIGVPLCLCVLVPPDDKKCCIRSALFLLGTGDSAGSALPCNSPG